MITPDAAGTLVEASLATDSHEPRLSKGWIWVGVEALTARDPKAALLDEMLVDVPGVLERLSVWRGLSDQLRDMVHNTETHAIHHAAGTHAGLQG